MKLCPKHRHVEMIEQPIHFNYYLKDELGAILPRDEKNTLKMYMCPRCGYIEWYRSSR